MCSCCSAILEEVDFSHLHRLAVTVRQMSPYSRSVLLISHGPKWSSSILGGPKNSHEAVGGKSTKWAIHPFFLEVKNTLEAQPHSWQQARVGFDALQAKYYLKERREWIIILPSLCTRLQRAESQPLDLLGYFPIIISASALPK